MFIVTVLFDSYIKLMRMMVLLTFFFCAFSKAEVFDKSDCWLFQDFSVGLKPLIGPLEYYSYTDDIRYAEVGRVEDGDHVVPVSRKFQSLRGGEHAYLMHLSTRDFPYQKGSLMMWFKPHQKMDKGAYLLFGNRWAKFELFFNQKFLIGYYTDSARHFLKAPIPKENWFNYWHCIVLNWHDGKRELWLDGQLIAEQKEVPIPQKILSAFWFNKKPKREHGNLDLGPIAVFRHTLSKDQVQNIWQYPDQLKIDQGSNLGLQRFSYYRDEIISFRIPAAYKSIRFIEEVKKTEIQLPLDQVNQHGQLAVGAALFRPGRYHCFANDSGQPLFTLAINAKKIPDFPIGISGMQPKHYQESSLRFLRKNHFSFLSPGGYKHNLQFYGQLDRIYSFGLSFAPSLNLHSHRAALTYFKDPLDYFNYDHNKRRLSIADKGREEILQRVVWTDTGELAGTSSLTPFSPVGKQVQIDRLKDFLYTSKNHPALYAVSFDDEYGWKYKYDKEAQRYALGSYGKYERQYFTQQTGIKEAPYRPNFDAPTLVPDDDPYLLWMKHIGLPTDYTNSGLNRFYSELTSIANEIRPDVLTASWKGSEYGGTNIIMEWDYPTIWQPHPGYYRGHGCLDFAIDRHRARQKSKMVKPVHGMAGWWSHDLRDKDDLIVKDLRLTTYMHLVKGVKSMQWLCDYNNGKKVPDGQIGWGLLSRQDMVDQLTTLTAYLHQMGPLFKNYEFKSYSKLAVLYSDENRMSGPYHFVEYDRFYPALRVAGVEATVISDDDVYGGKLADFDALLLISHNYSSEGHFKSLQAFTDIPGKYVFADSKSTLIPEGAIALDYNARSHINLVKRAYDNKAILDTQKMHVELIRKKIKPLLGQADIELVGSDHCAAFELEHDQARFLMLVNYNLFQQEQVEVHLKNFTGVVYDMDEKKVIDFKQFKVSIDAANWKTYMLLPEAIHTEKALLNLGTDNFEIQLELKGEQNMLSYALPVQVSLFHNDRKVLAYETNTLLGAGQVLKIPISHALDSHGSWHCEILNLVTGAKIKTVEVQYE